MAERISTTDEQLLTAFSHGDRNAFTAIYEKYWYKVYLVAYRRLKQKEVAEEIVQDLFVNLWKKRETIQVTQLENYLMSSVKYAIINHAKSVVLHKNYEAYYESFASILDSDTENKIAFNELTGAVENAITKLPSTSKDVFRLSRLEHLSIPEIANSLSISEKMAEYHLTKSLKLMRVYLKEFTVSAMIFLYVS